MTEGKKEGTKHLVLYNLLIQLLEKTCLLAPECRKEGSKEEMFKKGLFMEATSGLMSVCSLLSFLTLFVSARSDNIVVMLIAKRKKDINN